MFVRSPRIGAFAQVPRCMQVFIFTLQSLQVTLLMHTQPPHVSYQESQSGSCGHL